MAVFKERKCEVCTNFFTPKGPAGRFCEVCSEQKRLDAARRGTMNYRIRNGLVQNSGVGKGGANKRGSEDTQFETGIAYFMKSRKKIKEERRFCERCSKDLLGANRWQWVIHHKDHDRTNNIDENFELLCKRCHQIEHECHKAFSSRATTIPQGSRD